MGWSRRDALAGLGAAGVVRPTPARAESVWMRVRRPGRDGDVSIRGPAALTAGLPLALTAFVEGPSDADVFRVDARAPDRLHFTAPRLAPAWRGTIRRPPGESSAWGLTVTSAFVQAFGPMPDLMGGIVDELVQHLRRPCIASVATSGRVRPYAAPADLGGSMVAALHASAVPLDHATWGVAVVHELLSLRAGAQVLRAVGAASGWDVSIVQSCPSGPTEAPLAQVVALRPVAPSG